MSNNSWNQTLATLKAAGPTLTNSTTAATLLGTGATQDARFNLPSNFLNVGSKLRIRAAGAISTAPSGPGTLTFSVYIGSVAVYTGSASGTLATSASSLPFTMEIDLTCRSVGGGTNATMEGSGTLISAALSATTPIQLLGSSVGSGFDSTASGFVDLYGAWSVASASNIIQLQDYELISCN